MIRRTVLVLMTALLMTAHAAEEAPPPWERELEKADIRADFTRLYDGLKSAHVNLYANRSVEEYDALFDKTLRSIDGPMRLVDVQTLFQTFTAFGQVAHANIAFPAQAYDAFREGGGKTFPLYLTIIDSRVFVAENYSGNSSVQLGDELLTMNGRPIRDWLSDLSVYISADTPRLAHALLEFQFARYLWLAQDEIDSFLLSLRTVDGSTYTTELKASTRAAQQAIAARGASDDESDDELRAYKRLSDSVAYLKPGPFYHAEDPSNLWDTARFSVFIDEAFESVLRDGVSRLIIDLRENPGGDNSFSDLMVSWIADEPFRFYSSFRIRSSEEAKASNQARIDASGAAASGVSALFAKEYARTPKGETFAFELPYTEPCERRFEGEVYVLINRHSYSNAVNVAALIQDYGFGTIVGEKTADMATTYGAMESFTLPHSQLAVGFPKAHIVRPSGDERPDGVTPDWVIPSPILDTSTDPMLQNLLDRLK